MKKPINKKEIDAAYRRLFSTRDGLVVFKNELLELGFVDELVENTESLILQNHARRLLKHCGILTQLNLELFVDELFKKSVPE